MGYIDSNLLSGEEVIYTARIHWFTFAPGALLVAVGALMSINAPEAGAPVGSYFIAFGVLAIVNAAIAQRTAEMAITNRRVITKTGLISRKTVELNHSKVESFNINQGIMGRIFDFGTVEIRGTGGGHSTIKTIADPLTFRHVAMNASDEAK